MCLEAHTSCLMAGRKLGGRGRRKFLIVNGNGFGIMKEGRLLLPARGFRVCPDRPVKSRDPRPKIRTWRSEVQDPRPRKIPGPETKGRDPRSETPNPKFKTPEKRQKTRTRVPRSKPQNQAQAQKNKDPRPKSQHPRPKTQNPRPPNFQDPKNPRPQTKDPNPKTKPKPKKSQTQNPTKDPNPNKTKYPKPKTKRSKTQKLKTQNPKPKALESKSNKTLDSSPNPEDPRPKTQPPSLKQRGYAGVASVALGKGRCRGGIDRKVRGHISLYLPLMCL
nr:pollen-specific leucine-rich repeat extensin-like protein 1 [Penaeus vannamei]